MKEAWVLSTSVTEKGRKDVYSFLIFQISGVFSLELSLQEKFYTESPIYKIDKIWN